MFAAPFGRVGQRHALLRTMAPRLTYSQANRQSSSVGPRSDLESPASRPRNPYRLSRPNAPARSRSASEATHGNSNSEAVAAASSISRELRPPLPSATA